MEVEFVLYSRANGMYKLGLSHPQKFLNMGLVWIRSQKLECQSELSRRLESSQSSWKFEIPRASSYSWNFFGSNLSRNIKS